MSFVGNSDGLGVQDHEWLGKGWEGHRIASQHNTHGCSIDDD